MARKSKKDKFQTKKSKKWKAGIYGRRSFQDLSDEISDTILHQNEFANEFVQNTNDIEIFDYYTDDGYTGTDFNRPGFKRMLQDIVNGKINTVIVKDLSRLGRNYIEVGNYLEQIFPLYNVRFISINDNVDSFKDPKSINNVLIPLKNVMNDEYARDISNKVKSAYITMAKKGLYVSGTPPYGYKFDPEDKHKLIIDDDEAEIVKLIFKMALEGNGRISICKYLNNNNILCRKELQRRKKLKLKETEKSIYHWGTTTLARMLSNEVYIGNLVQNKTGSLTYKNHKQIPKPKNEWIISKETHQGIISKEDFSKVQKNIKINSPKKKERPKKYSIYNSKLKCADCGKAMYRMDDNRGNRNLSDYYCLTYKRSSNKCSPHKIKKSKLDKTVLDAIILQTRLVIDLDKTINALQNKNPSIQIECEKNIDNYKKQIDKIKMLKKISYEDWKFQKIKKEEYIAYSNGYDKEISNLQNQIEISQTIKNKNRNHLSKNNYWIEHFKRNKNVKKIDESIIKELINNIQVFADGSLKITFNYQDSYESAITYLSQRGDA